MDHHTKTKGDLGVLKVKLDLHQNGWTILNPETEHAPFDLVAYKDKTFKTIQVKYRSPYRGAINICFRTSWSDKNGSHSKQYDKSVIDLFAVYCPETDECYYFDPKLYKQSINLRIEPAKNNNDKLIHYAKEFRQIPG